MTLSAWMIAQDMRRIERDAAHLAALRQAREEARATTSRRGIAALVAATRSLLASDPRPVAPECCPA